MVKHTQQPHRASMPHRFTQKRNSLGLFMGFIRGGLTINQMIEAWKVNQGRKRAEEDAKNIQEAIERGVTSGKLQNASLGTIEDAHKLGLTSLFSGVFLGYLDGTPLFLPNDFHLSTCGMAGSGKSVTLSIPNCISTALTGESLIAFDLKDAELTRSTIKGRSAIDEIDSIKIDPWQTQGKNIRINFLSDLIDKVKSGKKIVDDAEGKIQMIYGSIEKEGNNAWIKEDAMKLAHILLLEWATNDPSRCTPGSFWGFGALPYESVKEELEALFESDAGHGHVSTMARKFHSQYCQEWSQQFEWMHDAFQKGFNLFGLGSDLREATSATDFDIRLLKKRPQGVYIIIPDDYADSHGKYIALLLDYVISTLARAKGETRTTILADEFANFPYAESTLKALRLYRSKGIRLWTFVQDRNGYSKYKSDGGHQPFEENSVSLVWGVSGSYAKELSEKAGYKSVIVQGHSTNMGVTASTGGINGGEQLTPVLPVSDISTMGNGKAVLDIKSKIFVIDRIPYWDCDLFKDYIHRL